MNTPPLSLRLYIAPGPSSLEALANLKQILADRPHDLEIVDVVEGPERALAENVLVTPTLVRLSPGPEIRIIGSLSLQDRVLNALIGP